MYSANVFSIQQWEKSANTSKAASSSVAEKWAVPSGLPVTQLLLWSWTREVDSQFLSLAKLMLLLNCSSITSTCEKSMILLVINYTGMEFRSGMIGDYCSWQRLCRSLQTCANKIFILLTKKKKKEKKVKKWLHRIKKFRTAFVSFQVKRKLPLFPWVQIFKAERKPF